MSRRCCARSNAGQHILDEVDVARHVDNADTRAHAVRHVQVHPGKAQINGHAARLFFFQAVRIDAGQRIDQGGFAVVNMPGGADDVHRMTFDG